MPGARPTILCMTSYEKGEAFLRECHDLGCRTLLLTLDALRDAPWPREAIDETYYMADLEARTDVLRGVSWLARHERIDRIVPLDEFDLEMAATLREHLRVPGMGESTVRYFRDKLAMRLRAEEAGVAVPAFSAILSYDALRAYMERVPPPWVLKPRTSASTIGIRRIEEPEALWRTLDELGDEQSFHLLERFVPGQVYHVDGIAADGELVFAECHAYARPPLEVYHGGGLFCSRTVQRGSREEAELREVTARLVDALGLRRGAVHAEFIRADDDGRLHFLEIAARVGGANIADMVRAATGADLWREWARVEVADARGEAYRVPEVRRDYGGIVLSLARQEWPDTSAYDDAEIVLRIPRRHHAGLVLASPDGERLQQLLDDYTHRFMRDFHAAMPPADKPTA